MAKLNRISVLSYEWRNSQPYNLHD